MKGGLCKVQTLTNIDDADDIEDLLSGTSEMIGAGDYEPLFARRMQNH
jgi:hypothetical protein